MGEEETFSWQKSTEWASNERAILEKWDLKRL